MSSFGDPEAKVQTYSRKEKSLGLLCVNFLTLYSHEQVDSVSLDEAASRLGVERRRIYDIVNVLESVGVLVRKAKNRYTWKGYDGIPKALEKLRETALNGNCIVKNLAGVSEMKQNNDQVCLASDDDDDEEHSSNENCCPLDNVNPQPKGSSNKSSPVSVLSEVSKSSPTKSKAGKMTFNASLNLNVKYFEFIVVNEAIFWFTDCRREKSLGLLTQKFVQLFLVTQAQIVTLEDAARVLLGECKESAKLKTKVRRLYDIANILSSLNLIEKTHNTENRKPAFKWLGIKDNMNYPAEMATRKRQFGTVISPNTNAVSVAPKSKRGRPPNKVGFESPLQPLNGTKRSALKPLQPRCTNIGGAVYNPVPVYPREGSSMPMPDMTIPPPRVPTSLTLGTSGGWREWTTADSNRASDQTRLEQKCSGFAAQPKASGSEPSKLTHGASPLGNKDCSSDFTFGPFCPFRLQQQWLASISSTERSDRLNDPCDENKDRESSSQDLEGITPFPLHYQNEALDQMFVHYMNAWKSWYLQVANSATTTTTNSASPPPVQRPCDSTTEST
eukprot:Gb_38482 [translate_table: standard]